MSQMEGTEGMAPLERHHGYRFRTLVAWVLVALCSVLTPFANGAQQEKAGGPEAGKKIRILLLVDATKPLSVRYESKGRAIWGNLSALALLPALIEAETASSERSKESRTLQETVGKFDRRPMIEAGIAAMFKASTPYFEAVVPQDPSLCPPGTAVDFDQARAGGFPYVLAVREAFAGMASAWAWGTLSAGSYLQFSLTDTATKKEMAKGQTNAFALRKLQFDPATTDRSLFTADYTAAVTQVCIHLYGELSRLGQLHAMAEAHGLGKEVPDVAALLAKYEKLFSCDFTLPKGWHQVAGPSKYQVSLEPVNADRAKFGVSFMMDLLVEEFGQKVDDLNEYIRIAFSRMRDQGYAVDTATPFDALALNPPYTAFLIDRPNGAGKEAVLFRRLDGPFVASYHIVFLADYDGFLKKYGPGLQSLINQSRIATHP
jgi:hypothetical protein